MLRRMDSTRASRLGSMTPVSLEPCWLAVDEGFAAWADRVELIKTAQRKERTSLRACEPAEYPRSPAMSELSVVALRTGNCMGRHLGQESILQPLKRVSTPVSQCMKYVFPADVNSKKPSAPKIFELAPAIRLVRDCAAWRPGSRDQAAMEPGAPPENP